MSPYPIGLKNPALVETIDRGWQLKAEVRGHENEKAMLEALYEELKSLALVGKILGVTGATVRNRFKKWDIERGGPGGSRKKKKQSTTWPFRCKKCGDQLYGDQRIVGLCVFCDPSIGFSAGSAEDVRVIY